MPFENDILGNREGKHQAKALTVGGDGCHLVVEHVPGNGVLDLLALHGDGAGIHLRKAVDGLHKLFLAVALDASDTNDLSGTNVEIEATHLLDASAIPHVEPPDREGRLARLSRTLLDS